MSFSYSKWLKKHALLHHKKHWWWKLQITNLHHKRWLPKLPTHFKTPSKSTFSSWFEKIKDIPNFGNHMGGNIKETLLYYYLLLIHRKGGLYILVPHNQNDLGYWFVDVVFIFSFMYILVTLCILCIQRKQMRSITLHASYTCSYAPHQF